MAKTTACARVLLVVACLAGAASALDKPALLPHAPELQGLTPDDARRLLAILADEDQRAQLMESLREIAGAPSGPGQPSPGQPSSPGEQAGAGQPSGPVGLSGSGQSSAGATEPSPAGQTSGPGASRAGQPSGPLRQANPDQARPAVVAQPEPSSPPAPAPPAISPEAAPQAHSAPGPGAQSAPAKLHGPSRPSIRLERGSLGAQLLAEFASWLRDVGSAVDQTIETATRYWQSRQQLVDAIEDPATLDRLVEIAWRLAAAIALALAAEWLTLFLLRRPRAALARHAQAWVVSRAEAGGDGGRPHWSRGRNQLHVLMQALARLPFVLGRLLLDLVPVLAFTLCANLLAATPLADVDVSRLVILAIANAYAVCRGIMCVVRAAVGSARSGPGVLVISVKTAAYVERSIRRIVAVVVFGIAAADTALLLGLDTATHDALVSIAALAGHVLVAIIIVQCRRPVAALIRGPVERIGPFAQFRLWTASVWHLVAIFLDFGLWAVWVFRLPNGYVLLLRVCLLSAVVVIVARLVAAAILGGFDRLLRPPPEMLDGVSGFRARAVRYRAVLRQVVSVATAAVAAVFLLEVWGVDAPAWFGSGTIGARLLWALVTVGIAAAVAVLVWEASNLAIERHLERLTQAEQYPRVVRLRTLLPVLRAVLLTVILVVVGMTALAEIGVNITPLLASAGIAGIAVGFGSQKLVQDVITGVFLMVENSMQVGEWVTAGGVSGNVERLTMRTVQLRGGDGALHIVPYSAVSTVSNTSRGTGNAAVNVSIARYEDIDRIGELLKEIAAGMRKDPRFAAMMRGDLDLWGVDKVEGSGVTLAGQIVCTDSGRWPVQREFNRRMKMRFEELGVQFAIPTQRVELRNPSAAWIYSAADRPQA